MQLQKSPHFRRPITRQSNVADNDDLSESPAAVSVDDIERILRNFSESGPKQNQRDRLIRLATEAELWHDPDGEAYITLSAPRKGHRENWPLRSKGARHWLRWRFYNAYGGAPGSQAFDEASRQLEAQALYEGAEHEVHLRIAQHEDRIYLDLCDPKWRAIEITDESWSVVSDPPVRFIRTSQMRALPEPQVGGDIEELRPFLNVATEDDFCLIVAFLLAALRPSGPYPVLMLQGEQGSAKSTATRMLRSLVDPNAVAFRGAPREERDLVAAARNARLVCFDNMSTIQSHLADAICRLATGGGLGGRQLYTDHDEAVFEAQRPVILNGIPDLAWRGDLADRAIPVTLEPIAGRDRRSENTLWEQFESARPRVLGALLDAVACALGRLPEVELTELPRMADFAQWVTAAEPALEWSDGTFLNAYQGNQAAASLTIVDGDPVAAAIRQFMEDGEEYDGTASELLEDLEPYRPTQRGSWWPTDPARLGIALRRARQPLQRVGIEVELSARTASHRRITIKMVG